MPPTTDSFMYQTMHRQPADVRNLVGNGWEQAAEAAEIVESARRVFVTRHRHQLPRRAGRRLVHPRHR